MGRAEDDGWNRIDIAMGLDLSTGWGKFNLALYHHCDADIILREWVFELHA